ncbi:hypothetical protein C7212DRAFT_304458 [Tuber magnatum]|uniref:Uncharacterized protein n=1 Tax=Tuber magnatum TaxID=42249 RepID=A0A317SY34_9PEZI|nr:hypothetical protein C7212DRAFT_304458 [Tuber magnatum]
MGAIARWRIVGGLNLPICSGTVLYSAALMGWYNTLQSNGSPYKLVYPTREFENISCQDGRVHRIDI